MLTAIMPSRGDVFNTVLFLKFYKKYWQDTVDNLIIHINSPVEKKVVDFMTYYIEQQQNVKVMYTPHYVDHGGSLTEMVKTIDEGDVLFLEEDTLILNKEFVNNQYAMMLDGSCDAIGVIRGCCNQEIMDKQKELYNCSGYNLAPYFTFCKVSDLKKTDLVFVAKRFPQGSTIEPIDLFCNVDMAGDTFVWMSIQLRALGLKIIEQWEIDGGTVDYENYCKGTGIFSSDCQRIHHHTLFMGNLITDDGLVFDSKETSLNKGKWVRNMSDPVNQMQIHAWARLALKVTRDELVGIEDFIEEYKYLADKDIALNELDINFINKLEDCYRTKIGL